MTCGRCDGGVDKQLSGMQQLDRGCKCDIRLLIVLWACCTAELDGEGVDVCVVGCVGTNSIDDSCCRCGCRQLAAGCASGWVETGAGTRHRVVLMVVGVSVWLAIARLHPHLARGVAHSLLICCNYMWRHAALTWKGNKQVTSSAARLPA
jgi:hypothetical protein